MLGVLFFVPTTGLEPVAYGLEIRCSIQLSYVGKIKKTIQNASKSNYHLIEKEILHRSEVKKLFLY